MTPIRILFAALAALAFAAAPAGAATKSCAKHKGTLTPIIGGSVWHAGGSLYACTTVYGHRPRTFRMGPYAPQTRLDDDGVDLVWTTPLTRNGVRSDRIWAGSADSGKRWMSGKLLVPASGDQPEREARIMKLTAVDRGAAWVTRGGDVGFALQTPENDPEPTGTLPAPLKADGRRLLVGSFGAAATEQIAKTLKLVEEDGEGDECGGSNYYDLTFQATPGTTIGAYWMGGWTSTGC